MQKIKAFSMLVRLPNLIFIFLTQLLIWYELIRPLAFEQQLLHPVLHGRVLLLLILSTVLIAAAGYMINDYFDIGIDAINKPERVTIEKIFKRRTIIVWHIVLNVIALLMVTNIALHYLQLRYILLQLISIFLLVVYSTTFKRKLIVGNFVISILTALSLFTIAAYEPAFPIFNLGLYPVVLFWLYVFFAFLITFSREVIKDIEDIKGDDAQHCKTIPLVWGIQAAKNVVYVLIALLLMLLLVVCFYQSRGSMFLIASITTIMLSLLVVVYKIHQATNTIHFHTISTYLKWITLAGILSLLCHSTLNNIL
jgi:4-hydroxybenzoate polyprenyltransferase